MCIRDRVWIIILVEFNITKYSDYSASGAGAVFFSNEPCSLSYEKCISIFHLPPFSVYLSNYQRNEWVEDSVFKPFIFHLYLPSSTHCFWWIRYWSVIVYSVLSICLCRLKHFLFLSIFSENGPDFISSRMSGPISPHTCAHEPVYPGPPARVYGLR